MLNLLNKLACSIHKIGLNDLFINQTDQVLEFPCKLPKTFQDFWKLSRILLDNFATLFLSATHKCDPGPQE